MFAVIETATGIVFHLCPEPLVIEERGVLLPNGSWALDVKPDTHEVISVDPPAFTFFPGLVAYSGGSWSVTDQDIYDLVTGVPEPSLPVPVLVASGTFQVADGNVSYSGQPAGISFAMQLSTGVFWLFFLEEQPDTSYAIYAGSSQGLVNYTERQTDYFELSVTDGGAPLDPSEFSINVIVTRAI